MKRAYSPKEIINKTYGVLPWCGRWEVAFGYPEENSTWFISGASASGKSSFVMQLAEELTHYGRVLYMSYEEGVSQSFKERLLRFGLGKRQGWFRVSVSDSVEDLTERLRKRHSAKFIIVDSIQEAGWEWPETKRLLDAFPNKSFIFVSQEAKGQPLGKGAIRLRYHASVKVRVVGFRAYCQGRFNADAGNSFVVWEEGVLRTTNNVIR
ncbi:MAG: bifunctional adenosylcobinamide kinase/adenosylcobinamide-phosphate guanylyltransferase [Bacteroidaceae bacterium]|nr:bifunctional adenosylcobinamide kinase/adenosylcobinamide-phosphate guanylyltransferase [Bacteroidaceae bacterium]